MIDVIAFDADDTLWRNETRYSEAKGEFVQLLQVYQSAETIQQRLDETEVQNVQVYGYGIKSFTLSMIETAVELSSGRIEGREIQRIIEIARAMLTAPIELYAHVAETLEKLSKKHKLMLITKGDRFEQESKIAKSGIGGYFGYVEIVGDKTITSYQAILARYSISPRRFLMVGNSMRSDILPVVRLGGWAVYIPQADTWSHENAIEQSLKAAQYHQLEHLGQLPELVLKLSKGVAE